MTGGGAGETFNYTLADNFSDRFEIVATATGFDLVVKIGAGADDTSLFNYEGINTFALAHFGDKAAERQSSHAAPFTINLTNVNEAPIDVGVLTLSAPAIAENAANGTEIGPLAAIDPDANDTFTFTLTDSAGGRFKLDASGKKLVVADGAKLDFETATSHKIKLQVKDAGGLTFEKTITIGVKDGIDTVSGTKRNDKITGTEGADVLNGDAGNDKIYGLGGDDIINGGLGKDQLTGGAGKDIFVFDAALRKGGFDQVTDFNSADDTLQFNLSALKSFNVKGLKHGKLPKKFFTVGSKSKDKNDYVYYNKKNGFVYLDADGSGHHKGNRNSQAEAGHHGFGGRFPVRLIETGDLRLSEPRCSAIGALFLGTRPQIRSPQSAMLSDRSRRRPRSEIATRFEFSRRARHSVIPGRSGRARNPSTPALFEKAATARPAIRRPQSFMGSGPAPPSGKTGTGKTPALRPHDEVTNAFLEVIHPLASKPRRRPHLVRLAHALFYSGPRRPRRRRDLGSSGCRPWVHPRGAGHRRVGRGSGGRLVPAPDAPALGAAIHP